MSGRCGHAWRARSTAAGLILALTACLGPQEQHQPLSSLVLRSTLVGPIIVATENGQAFTFRLARNGVATRSAPAAEFGRWRTGENGALCLRWHDEGERCAPVYAAGVGAHYRWGDTDLSVLGRR